MGCPLRVSSDMNESPLPAPATEAIARVGLGARAFVYFAVATLLLDSVFTSKPDDGASPGDAFRAIETQLGGRILLIALAIGLFLYAGWRFQQAALDMDNKGSDAKGILARFGMASSGGSYLLLGIAAFTVTLGSNESSSGGGATKSAAQWMMDQPFGQWAVALGGLILMGIGCAQIWRAKTGHWKDGLDLSGWAGNLTSVIAFGIGGRGILFIAVGGFLLLAGISADSSDVRGLAETMGWLRYQPFGLYLFIASAVAIGLYGLYSAVQTLRYKFPDS